MHYHLHKLVVGSVAVLSILTLVGCAELKKDLPPAGGALTVHEKGWTDAASGNFHGTAVRNASWDMTQCQSCHGTKYDGGIVDVSCRTCHNLPAGPENCTTCHGSLSNPAPPRDLNGNTSTSARGVGSHQKHLLGGTISSGVVCSDCHRLPPAAYVQGHLDSPLPAEVTMNSYIALTITNKPTTTDYDASLPLFSPSPAYDSNTLSCASTYCHGNFKNGNPAFAPIWNNTTGSETACGTCHGNITKPTLAQRALPRTLAEGGTHPDSLSCSTCHIGVVNSSLVIIDKTKHINGKLTISGEERDF